MEKVRVKPGRMDARPSPSLRNSRTQNEWNVEICGGLSRFISSSSEATRERISPAALLVNVTARTADAGTCFALIRCEMRCVMTRVLPLPAPARIRTGPSVVSTASRCWGLRPERKSTTDHFRTGAFLYASAYSKDRSRHHGSAFHARSRSEAGADGARKRMPQRRAGYRCGEVSHRRVGLRAGNAGSPL